MSGLNDSRSAGSAGKWRRAAFCYYITIVPLLRFTGEERGKRVRE
jgi:hypothetical protein